MKAAAISFCPAHFRLHDPDFRPVRFAKMTFGTLIRRAAAAVTLMAALSLVVPALASAVRDRPDEVTGAVTSLAPSGFQIYNDYATPESMYSATSAVVHYVTSGIDAPPLTWLPVMTMSWTTAPMPTSLLAQATNHWVYSGVRP